MQTAVATNDKADTAIMSSYREAAAKRIRELMQAWTDNIFDLGKELKRARDTFQTGPKNSRPGWGEWISNNVGMSDRHARAFIRIHEELSPIGDGVAKLATSFRVLEFLARDHIPDEARQDVLARIGEGEKIGLSRAKEIVEPHRPRPTPTEARQQARETGRPVVASDGFIYLGATKEHEEEVEEVRTLAFKARRAIQALAEMGCTPKQFLARVGKTQRHLLWSDSDEHQITEALEWLEKLHGEFHR